MKIFSPHRRKMEAKRKYGGKEFQNKVKKAQEYKRIYDPRNSTWIQAFLRTFHLESRITQFFVIAIIGVIGYYLFISPYFLLKDISVSGTERVSIEQVQNALREAGKERWFFIPKTHLLLLSKNYAEQLIIERLPLVKELNSFKRVWPDKVEVEIVERRPGFAFEVGGQNYLIDEEGVAVKELDDLSGLPHVIDQVNEDMKVGEQLTNTKLVAFILSASRQWPSKIQPALKEIKVPGKAAAQVQFVSSEGWEVFFDINRAVDSQLSNLNLIITRQVPAKNRLELAYIDMRVDKSVYLCYKSSACVEQPPADPNAEAAVPTDGVNSGAINGASTKTPTTATPTAPQTNTTAPANTTIKPTTQKP